MEKKGGNSRWERGGGRARKRSSSFTSAIPCKMGKLGQNRFIESRYENREKELDGVTG